MSNCITLHKDNTVTFSRDEIDIDRARKLVESAALYPFEMVRNDEVAAKANGAYWYFSSRNVFFGRDWVKVYFEGGNSSHTWRSFRYALLVLIAPLMKTEKRWSFQASDESDGHRSKFWIPVEFKSGQILEG
jgi:hypothetical protein